MAQDTTHDRRRSLMDFDVPKIENICLLQKNTMAIDKGLGRIFIIEIKYKSNCKDMST